MSKKSNKNKSKFIVIGVAVLFIALIVLAICFNNAEKIIKEGGDVPKLIPANELLPRPNLKEYKQKKC